MGVATHDIELIEYFFAHTITPAFVAVLIPAAVIATLWVFGWPLALVLLPFLLYAALTPVLARARIDRLGSRAREMSGDLNAHAADSVQGLGEIVAFQRVRARGEEFAAKAKAYLAVRVPFLRDLTLQSARQEVATGLGGLAVVLAGAWLAASGRLDGGMLPLLTLLAMSAFVPVWEIAQVGRQLADTLGAARRVYAVHAEPVPVTDGPGVRRTSGIADIALEMTRVSFAYPGRRRRALTDVSFSVPAGSTVALVGPSGAGKTTVANLMLRFWDPDAGVVRLGGHDLREYELDDLRRRIALVAQDTYLFNDTLRSNILLARPGAGAEELLAAVDKAALDDFVAALPDGLETVVGERGRPALGRTAPARGHCPGLPEGRPHPDPGRGDVAPRRGERAGGALRPRRALARPHDGGHRPSPVDGAGRRPDHRARRRARGGGRCPREPARPRRALRAPRLPPAHRRGRLVAGC